MIGLIIPTRYGSKRLTGKVLCEINGKLQIERIIERALKSQYIDIIVLAITDKHNECMPIIKWYNKKNSEFKKKVKIHIGIHSNILKRTLEAAKVYDINIIVDISHDCTFFDPYLADRLIERLFSYKADYSTNIITRSFPDGFDIQVYTRKIYQKVHNVCNYNPWWTGWNIFYAREEIFPKPKIINLEASINYYYPHWHLCLDTEEDKILIEKIYKRFGNSTFYYKDIINYLEGHKELLKINKNVIPTKLDKELL